MNSVKRFSLEFSQATFDSCLHVAMETGVRGVPGRIVMMSAVPEGTAQLGAGQSGANLRDVHVE